MTKTQTLEIETETMQDDKGKEYKNKHGNIPSVFETLNEINVNEKVEKKNGLTYLSWAWAWAEVLKVYPNTTYTIYETTNPQGYTCNYFTDGNTAWVKTGITINGIERIEELPVMDNRNNSIKLENLTSFNVNKAIQRSLTKALARHGLGLYIYAGEDLPEVDKEKEENKQQATMIISLQKAQQTLEKLGVNTHEGAFQEYVTSKTKLQSLDPADLEPKDMEMLLKFYGNIIAKKEKEKGKEFMESQEETF